MGTKGQYQGRIFEARQGAWSIGQGGDGKS
jgi:hypothetical protein